MNLANRNTLWASVFVSELAHQGLQEVVIAPGSRSTPLVMAFAEITGVRPYVLNDERSAAYFALGLARAGGKPAALVCTSGTAAANFLPAVIEAHYSETPLLVLTADRPVELRDSGANQTIDQVKLFGDYVRWYAELPVPEANPAPMLLRAVRAFAARAWWLSQTPLPGPVHLNLPFRKPLEPTPVATDLPDWLDDSARAVFRTPNISFARPRFVPDPQTVIGLTEFFHHPEGLIVCGPRCPAGDFPYLITALAERLGWPLLADALSGLRFGPHVASGGVVLGGYDTFLQVAPTLPPPRVVLRFGDLPTSTVLSEYLAGLEGVPQIAISETGRWRDDHFCLSHLIWADPSLLCREWLSRAPRHRSRSFLAAWQAAERMVWQTLATIVEHPDFEGGILPQVVEALPEGSALFVANSLPVRHLDQFTSPASKPLRVFANRGASGIDGTLSSALGAAVHYPGLVFVSGDLSFYHDMNGLLALRRADIQAVIVVINNDGGGIFHRLPVARFQPPFEEMFVSPHGLMFEQAAHMYGLRYHRPARADLGSVLTEALASRRPTLIEISSHAAGFERLRQEFLHNVAQKIQS